MQSYAKPTAPTDCLGLIGTVTVGCANPTLSEVRQAIFSDIDTAGVAVNKPSGDPSLAASWTGIIDNNSANLAKQWDCTGDMPAAAENVVIVHGEPKPILKERIINLDFEAVTPTQEEALRKMQYGTKNRLWLVTKGVKLIGGQEGILAVCTMAEPDRARGANATKIWRTKWVFYDLVSPPETDSPFIPFN